MRRKIRSQDLPCYRSVFSTTGMNSQIFKNSCLKKRKIILILSILLASSNLGIAVTGFYENRIAMALGVLFVFTGRLFAEMGLWPSALMLGTEMASVQFKTVSQSFSIDPVTIIWVQPIF